MQLQCRAFALFVVEWDIQVVEWEALSASIR